MIKRITICGFRGILAPLTLDLTKNGKPQSTLIYGRNGTGKSSVADAWEWFRYNKIDHLAREGAGPSSYPNFSASFNETFVELEFSTSTLGTLRLTYDHEKITKPHTNRPFEDLTRLTPHPCHICFADLTRFVYLTKSDRYDLLAQFMGFLPQVEAQKTLRRVQRQFQDKVETLSIQFTEIQKRLASKIGQNASTLSELSQILSSHYKRNNLIPPLDIEQMKTLVENLRTSIKQDPAAARLSIIKELVSTIRSVLISDQSLKAIRDYLSVTNPFKEKEEELKGIMLIELYKHGLEAISKLKKADICPLCGQFFNGDFCEHIQTKLIMLKELKERHDTANNSHSNAINAIKNGKIFLDKLQSILGEMEGDSAINLSKTLIEELAGLNNLYSNVSDLLSSKPTETDTQIIVHLTKKADEIESALKSVLQLREKSIQMLLSMIKPAEQDTARSQLITDFEDLSAAADIFSEQIKINVKLKGYKIIVEQLNTKTDEFVADCTTDVTKRFEEISGDVATFFHILEEDYPGFGDPILRILEDQDRAVIPEITFHGKKVSPAYKYLSESQLNSFGLSVFLASVKHFNPEFNFILLDDVVNSLDGYKRPKLLRILKTYFSDKQVLLLTHDSVWRDRIIKELPNWKRFHFKRHEFGIGPIVAEQDTTIDEIEQLIWDDKAKEAGQKLGPLMESELQELCEHLEVELKYNRRGEYTLETLLIGLRTRVKNKLKDHKLSEELIKLSEEIGFRNLCAHHKNPEIDITPQEMNSVIVRWKSILNMVRCQELTCTEFVRWNDPYFSCLCGKKKLVKALLPT